MLMWKLQHSDCCYMVSECILLYMYICMLCSGDTNTHYTIPYSCYSLGLSGYVHFWSFRTEFFFGNYIWNNLELQLPMMKKWAKKPNSGRSIFNGVLIVCLIFFYPKFYDMKICSLYWYSSLKFYMCFYSLAPMDWSI